MAVTYGFFDSVGGDRKYNADTMSEFYTGICSQGVFQSVDNGLAVSAGTGLTVNVATGRAIIQGHWVKNDAVLTKTISAASATYARIDAVVIRFSKSNRNISIVVKDGTPAASPSAPAMTRTSDVYELCLAYVNVAANATSVTVTDKRSNTSVCGWAAVAQSIDGTYEAMIDDIKTGFDGVTYSTPGNAVRSCDQMLSNKIEGLHHFGNYTELNVTNGNSYWVNVPIKNGKKYKITNNTSAYMACATFAQDKTTTVQTLVGVNANGTYTFTASADAYYLLLYAQANGTAIVEDTTCVIPNMEKTISDLGITLDKVYKKFDLTVTSGYTAWVHVPIVSGRKYRVVNNTSAAIPLALYAEDKTTVLKQYAGVLANSSFTFTADVNAYYLLTYFSAAGTAVIEDISTEIGQLEEDKLVEIGTGTQYPTIKEGFTYAVNNNRGVIIKPGTYDLVSEGISGNGYTLPKKVVGYGVILTCNLSSEDWTLSPLNCNYLGPMNVEVYGLTVICSNCRYCIHDDMGAMDRGKYYHHVFKDLTLIHNSAPSSVLLAPNNIGGGFGDAGDVLVENCVMKSAGTVNSDYHSSFAEVQTSGCSVKFVNCVMDKKVSVTNLGSSSDYINKMYVSNCLCGSAPEQNGSTNVQLIAWNNVVNS